MRIPGLEELRLVGGTALALQLGHRRSIDLNLFGELQIEDYDLTKAINKIGKATILKNTPNIKIYTIDNIKVDIVNYFYPWITEPIKDEEFTLASANDIAAMKLAAITGRGTRKDFIDIYFLLQKFTLKEILSFYEDKYADGSVFLVLKSLIYFKDAEEDENPMMFKPVDWEKVKQTIVEVYKEFMENS